MLPIAPSKPITAYNIARISPPTGASMQVRQPDSVVALNPSLLLRLERPLCYRAIVEILRVPQLVRSVPGIQLLKTTSLPVGHRARPCARPDWAMSPSSRCFELWLFIDQPILVGRQSISARKPEVD